MGLGKTIRVTTLLVVPGLSLLALAIMGRLDTPAIPGILLGIWTGLGIGIVFLGLKQEDRDAALSIRPKPDAGALAPPGSLLAAIPMVHPTKNDQAERTAAMLEELPELERAAIEVEGGTSAVKDTFGEVMSLTANLNSDLEKIAVGARKQAMRYQEIGNLAEDMAESTSSVSSRAEAMAASAGQTLLSARSGAAAITKTIDEMKAIRNTVVENAEKIRQLGDRSTRIGEIVTVIGGLANQTNLLALNAAIEAARAGEQGRGFAVVASEVRRLAERSNKAAKDIAELVGDITGQTSEAILAMQSGTEQVEAGVVLADEAGRALGEIDRVVEQSASEIRYISESAAQSAQRIEELVRSIEDISAITEENSVTIKQIAEADWFSKAIRRFENLAEDTHQKSALVLEKVAALRRRTAS